MPRLVALLAILTLAACAPVNDPRSLNDALLKAHEDSEAGR